MHPEQIAAVATLERELPCSVELTRNAKGDYQWAIKEYHEPGDEFAAIERCRWADSRLRELFLPNNGSVPEGTEARR